MVQNILLKLRVLIPKMCFPKIKWFPLTMLFYHSLCRRPSGHSTREMPLSLLGLLTRNFNVPFSKPWSQISVVFARSMIIKYICRFPAGTRRQARWHIAIRACLNRETGVPFAIWSILTYKCFVPSPHDPRLQWYWGASITNEANDLWHYFRVKSD